MRGEKFSRRKKEKKKTGTPIGGKTNLWWGVNNEKDEEKFFWGGGGQEFQPIGWRSQGRRSVQRSLKTGAAMIILDSEGEKGREDELRGYGKESAQRRGAGVTLIGS